MTDPNNLPELPKGWVWTQIGEITMVASGGTPSTKKKDYFGGDIPWITPADLSGYNKKFISHGARNITQKGLNNSSARILPAGTVIFSSRAPVGYVAIAANKLCTNQGFKNFIVPSELFNEYVYYYLKGNKALAEEYASGTTFLELSANKAGQLPFPLPPLPEQHRIVAKIEELFSRLDAGVEALRKVQLQLKRYRQSVLKAAFEGQLTAEWREAHKAELEPASAVLERIKVEWRKKLGSKYRDLPPIDISELPEIPEGWAWIRLFDLIESMKNGIYKPSQFYTDNGTACLRMYNIENGFIVWKDIKRMNLSAEDILEYELKPDDILVNRVNSRELVGKSARIPEGLERCVYESKNIRLRLIKNWTASKYINFWFLINSQRYYNRNTQQTVGMASINQEQLASMPIPITSLNEQNKVVEEIERYFSIADETEQVVEKSLKQAERLRQSILKSAFEGKLVQQDPNDEPAKKLLERIKAEKMGKKNSTKEKKHEKIEPISS